MTIPPFDESEMTVSPMPRKCRLLPDVGRFSYPVPPRGALAGAATGEAVWQITDIETLHFAPRCVPDNPAKGGVFDAEAFDPETDSGGKDMFGIEWVYVPVAGGSIVKPGDPLLGDANEWRERLSWPDPDAWGWEESARINNAAYLDTDSFVKVWIYTGFFERLVSFMDFMGASIALADDGQRRAVAELMDALADLYIGIVDRFIESYSNIDGFYVHDDWGSNQNAFFSPSAAAELFVPAMRRLNDHIHSRGKVSELHSCGNSMVQIENHIAAGWDMWSPQAVNDTRALYREHGDRIIIGTVADGFPEGASEEEMRAAAVAYADEFCNPDRPSVLGMPECAGLLTPPFREELYRRSRLRYSGAA